MLRPSAPPIPANAPHMSKQTRFEIIRDFETQLVYARAVFPMGTKGIKLRNGVTYPNGIELQQALALYGPSVRPGDPTHISFVQIKGDHIHFEINGTRRSLEWNGQEPNSIWIGQRGMANNELIKDPVVFYPDAAPYARTPGGLGEGYLDTFRSIFGDFHSWILSAKSMDIEHAGFPSFFTGLSELNIVDAVLQSARTNKWVDVNYMASHGTSYL